ncbi:ankyrin repeat domain-containing protein 27-like isoform X2 [Mizuhopecten yessoensis]|uniref:ankyrin repeat domain-containing protein 27-like isoform X2 n=1 Tax=Mizuhopecten yessoensis TaxID=6573 RepID=UPI000B45AD04|nr:ankyrin repeat domain-containing protein 27-like isoform X2 [Mizuhopecten yessoensis]
MDRYDEDIYDNPFFVTLTTKFTDVYEEATSKRWTLCVPKYASVVKEPSFSREDITEHVVLQLQDGGEEFKSFSNKKLTISNGNVNVLPTDTEPTKTVPILFEEIFYNNNNESFRVLCINCLLNRSGVESGSDQKEKITKRPASFDDCKEILFGHPGGKKTEDTLSRLLESFSLSYTRLRGESFRSLVDAANAQFTKSMQTVLKDTNVRRSAQHSQSDMDNLKVAVETYIMHALHRHLFQTLTACVSSADSEVNKMVRNSTEVKPRDLGIRSEFVRNIVSAKKELVRINKFSTPMGRLSCLKRVVTNLSKPLSQNNGETNDPLIMSTDDFLPILILLVVKSEIPNWTANLMYMKYFHFSKTSEDDEYAFYLTTVEAALQHIRSGCLKEEAIKAYRITESEFPDQKTVVGRQLSGGTSIVDKFFQYVQYGDETAVTQMLRRPRDSQDQVSLKLCHPLCSCDKCAKLTAQHRTDVNLVTAYTRDDRGYTALHIASLNGQAHLIDLLIKNGALVNASDYLSYTPLHLACQKGHQNIILLLVHFNADCTQTDGEGNTPLHLCVDSGHEDCVKAMVFLEQAKTKLDINAQNVRGDTAIHLAAKWGYENIVSILLENDAQPSLRNRKKQTPFNIAQSSKVQELLKMAASMPKLEVSRSKSKSMSEYAIVTKKDVALEAPPPPTPITHIVASLDQVENRQLEKLYNSINDGDLPMVKFHLGWSDLEEDEDFEASPMSSVELCHPLCQCDKCRPIQKSVFCMSSSGRNGININTRDASGYTPLLRAVLCGNLEFVQLFLQRGANVNCQTIKHITPLHLACFLGENKIAKILVKNGAQTDVRDQAGDTPVHICCGKGNIALLDLLVENSADVNLTNLRGNTPLHLAAVNEKLNVVKRLVSLGTNVTAVNMDNLTPVQLAVKNPEIQAILAKCIPKQSPVKEDQSGLQIQSKSADSPVSIHDLFSAFEAKDLSILNTLNHAIREFDARTSLKTTTVRDASEKAVTILRQQHSIKKFDLRGLKHVQSLDKSDPLHIYRLSVSEMNPDSENQDPQGACYNGADDENHGVPDACNKRVVGENHCFEGACGKRAEVEDVLGKKETALDGSSQVKNISIQRKQENSILDTNESVLEITNEDVFDSCTEKEVLRGPPGHSATRTPLEKLVTPADKSPVVKDMSDLTPAVDNHEGNKQTNAVLMGLNSNSSVTQTTVSSSSVAQSTVPSSSVTQTTESEQSQIPGESEVNDSVSSCLIEEDVSSEPESDGDIFEEMEKNKLKSPQLAS